MAMKLKEQGIIDGIGMQSHLDVSYPSLSIYKTAFEKFISTGLEIQITEFDITTDNDSSPQIELFKDIFQLFVDNADKISSVTFWNTNNYNWRRNNPLLFDYAFRPKEGFYVILEIAKAASTQKDDKKKFTNDESKEDIKNPEFTPMSHY